MIDREKLKESDPTKYHFNRQDNRDISYEPKEELFYMLSDLSENELEGLGLQLWSDEFYPSDQEVLREDAEIVDAEGPVSLWLLPVEWFDEIPDGIELVTINGEIFEFYQEDESLEGRFGALPYGVIKE